MSAQQPAAPPAAPAQTPAAPAAGRARGAAPIQQTVWSPKAVKPTGYTGVHKPHTKLADVLAKHKGETDWVESIVDDETLHGDYIMMGPGKKTPKRANVDTREWWIVRDGQIRFTIDGQEPFVASKGFLVQVPYRTFYSMETGGRSAVAAVRSEHRPGAQDLSGRRDARAGARRRVRARAHCGPRQLRPTATG